MSLPFSTLNALINHEFDSLIDVRSPAEFAEDHIPGAINLPALSNDQRAEVGTIYKQVSPFDARKVGAAMVARNVADHLDGPLAVKDGGWQPLVYCWRGGQRSGSFASILSQIGWRAETVEGGYQSFRRMVHTAVSVEPLPHRLILLDGNTGAGKTAILQRLATKGLQVLDLERLAGHRGSLLGALSDDQPSQKRFESQLAITLCGFDPQRPVIVEAESAKIGRINLPKQLWVAMIAAPRIVVQAPISQRAQFLSEAYGDIIAQPEELATRLLPLRYIRGHDMVDEWLSLLDEGAYRKLAERLIADHYDPAYNKSRNIHDHEVVAKFTAAKLDKTGLDQLADDIASYTSGL